MTPYNPTGFALQIFKERYAFTETETWDQACSRLSRQMVLPETSEKQSAWQQRFYDVLVSNLFVPGGRIWYNSGRHRPNLLNCFVLSNQLDSKEGWGNIARETIITSMCGGGCGIDFSDVRPVSAEIAGQRGAAPGPISLMQLIDSQAPAIRQGGNRRVAFMFSLDLTHTDIVRFLNAKLELGALTHANISVRSRETTEFIRAIKKNTEIGLSWKGKYRDSVPAVCLWKTIVESAYNRGDPGLINLEFAEKESTISYITPLVTTNPCGEITMSAGESCCLGHLVLPRFIVNGEIDWTLLGNTVRTGVRFLDNVLSVNYYPMVEQKEAASKFRRIGLGTTGLADAMLILGLKYGSEEGNKFISKLYRFISKAAYEASIMLAIEKKPFPACDPKKHVETGFVRRMPTKIRALIEENGIRNCALLTQAPTGTVSILSGNISSGIEPPFAAAYERRFWSNEVRQVETIIHPLAARFLTEGKSLENFVSARELSIRQHLEVQALVQEHVDNAVSKTVNIPEACPLEEMSTAWLEFLPRIKGTTFCRENTVGYMNKNGVLEPPPLTAISIEEAVRRGAHESNSVDCPKGVCEI